MQIELGVPTGDLNPVRNHLDQLKGGRLSRYIQPAQAIHFIAWGPYTYQHLTREQVWLHTLPERSTFADAIHSLKKWNAWHRIPDAVKKHLEQADPLYETVKVDEFAKMRTRIFGLMPDHLGALPAAGKKAASLGYQPHVLYNSVDMKAEARQVAMIVASIARNIEKSGQPFRPPSALIGRTEMIVTVGKEKGMGGRNQEYALEAARHIKGSARIIMGSVDTDGTDGPGKQFTDTFDEVPVLNGAIVDGTTISRAQEIGIDIHEALRCHNTSPVLYKLGDGVIATQNISMNDLSVTLISDA
jgi:glycerate-2-kinase